MITLNVVWVIHYIIDPILHLSSLERSLPDTDQEGCRVAGRRPEAAAAAVEGGRVHQASSGSAQQEGAALVVAHRRHRRPADDVFAPRGVVAVDGRLVAAGRCFRRPVLEDVARHVRQEVAQAAERHLLLHAGSQTGR